MRNASLPPMPAAARTHRFGSGAATLLCGLILLSACSGIGGLAPRQNQDTLTVLKPAVVDMSLRAQGHLQLQAFQQWIGLMQQYNGQTSNYARDLLSDRQKLDAAKTNADYRGVLQILQQQTASIRIPALKNEASYQLQQLKQQVSAWGKTHTFHDSYNGTTYRMGFEYGPAGVEGWVQDDLTGAKTIADYQQAVKDANTFLTNFQAYQTNASDSTPWNSPHRTDHRLMQHYHTLDQKVVVVSLSEQAMRVYNQGSLVKAFHVTTGRPEKPSAPGSWVVESKQSPTIFKSDEPRNSPYWYPDTPIAYAMLYHSGGYFLHDSWWRSNYGPDTQFPHYDSSGDSFSFDGSHGCVNLPTANAGWLYKYVNLYTHVIIY